MWILPNLILTCGSLGLALADPPASGPVRILTVGDSITETNAGHASWRYWLDHRLHDVGVAFDLVGSQHGVFGGAPLYADFDADHEAHSGWQTAEMSLAIGSLTTVAAPHVALVHLGNTDLNHAVPAGIVLTNLLAVVANLRASAPGAVILVAQIVPIEVGGLVPPELAIFNANIPALIAAVDHPESRVLRVDASTGFDPATDSYDGFHPSEAGEQKIAARFDAVLAPVVAALTAPGFVPGDRLEFAPLTADSVFETTFDGVEGEKIEFDFRPTAPSTHATLTVLDPFGAVVQADSLAKGKASDSTVVLQASGRFRIRIAEFDGALGKCRLETGRKLPKLAKKNQTTEETAAGQSGVSFSLRAFPRTRLDVKLKSAAIAASTVIRLRCPDGALLDVSHQAVATPNGAAITDLALLLPGDYAIEVSNPSGEPLVVKATIDPHPASAGHATIPLAPID